jgi:hypothetical protein
MAVLTEVIDGVTPITEQHPEEKRAAIGTTWDSASDWTLKQCSDAFPIDQANVDLQSAGNQPGEAVRYEEFNAEHSAADGTHKSSIIDQAQMALSLLAASTGEAVRYDEFVQEHGSAGGHSANIIDQYEVNLTSAAGMSGKAVRYNEFSAEHTASTGVHNVPQATGTGNAVRWDDWTQEHTDAGAHRSNVIDQDQIWLSSAPDESGEAVRMYEFNQEHVASTGAHRTDGWLVNSMVNASAAIAGTKVDAATTSTRGTVELATVSESSDSLAVQASDTRLRRKILYADSSVATGVSGNEASALTEYSMDDPGSNDSEDKIYVAYIQTLDPGQDHVTVHCEAQVTANPSPSEASVQLYITQDGSPSASNEQAIDNFGNWDDFTFGVDTSGLDAGVNMITVRLAWTSDSASGQTAKMRRCVLYTS